MSKSLKVNVSLSFNYNGKPGLLCPEEFERISGATDACGEKEITTEKFRHTLSGTEWKITYTRYNGFCAEEWSAEIYAARKTEVFSDIMWNYGVEGNGGKLIGNYGDAVNEFAEYSEDLTKNSVTHNATDGRPTHVYFPYYRIETDKVKTFAVLGAMGSWTANFTADNRGVKMRAGQYAVNTYLNKGETFVLPTLLTLPYSSDSVNTWRHFYMKHIMPKVNGKTVKPMCSAFNGSCEGLSDAYVKKVKAIYDNNGVDYDFWWCDAGTGTDGTGPHNKTGQWYHGVNFDMNFETFPDGLKSFGESLRSEGKDYMMWFEPELIRTPPDMWEGFLAAHPDFKTEWLVGTYTYDWCDITLTARMLDLGNDECREWLCKRVFGIMDNASVNIYRQDFNIPPYTVWYNADALDRKGYTENRYCAGLLRFYKDVRARYGNIFMDTCASGGGRCDLETAKLMIPLHYSDHQDVLPGDCNGHIYMQQVFWRWFPYTKNYYSPQLVEHGVYGLRSVMNPCVTVSFPYEWLAAADLGSIKDSLKEWRSIADCYLGDYYQLEQATRDDEHIKAFEFFAPENGKGFSMVFVPEHCKDKSYCMVPKGLNNETTYTVTNKDSGKSVTAFGKELCANGIRFDTCGGKSYLFVIEEKR